jgi:hypothetical protein
MANEKSTEIDRISKCFSEWRSQRVRGTRIPEHLWIEAHALAKSIGITATCRELRLNGSTLKKYGERLTPQQNQSAPRQTFLELPTLKPRFSEPSLATTLELEEGSRRITLRLDRVDDERLVRLAHRLLEQT